MFKVKYVDSIMMLVRLDLNLIVSLFQHKCAVSEKVSTTTLVSSICVNPPAVYISSSSLHKQQHLPESGILLKTIIAY